MDERRGDLGLTWNEIAAAAGVSPQTMYRAANSGARMLTTTRKGIERALRWESGSVEAILAGGEPSPLPEPEPEPEPPHLDDLLATAEQLQAQIAELIEQVNRMDRSGGPRRAG